jgi:hypothetical protein
MGLPGARKTGHSSPAGAASVGPGARDRRNGPVRGSVRSHRSVRSRPSAPRRRHCRPPASPLLVSARLRGQCWPASRAAGGRPALLAGARSTRTRVSSQAARSDGCPEQSQRAAPMRSCFSTRLQRRASHGAPPAKSTQPRLSGQSTASAGRSSGQSTVCGDLGRFSLPGHRHESWAVRPRPE